MGRPYILELNPGERKTICTCGKTQKAPFCDGSHKGTDCTPIAVHFASAEKVTISGVGCCGSSQAEPMQSEGCCSNLPKSKLPKSKLTEMQSDDHDEGHSHGGCCRH